MTPKIICVTPIRNEEWILDTFLKSASIWADHIIFADQNSADSSREIISKYPKASVIDNTSVQFNELGRQQMLLNAARQISGPKLIIAIDADEILSPEAFDKSTWENILSCEPGTIFNFQWATLIPNSEKYRLGYFFAYGYMDDGAKHEGTNYIHVTRVPTPEGHRTYNVTEFKIIHLQFMNPERNKHKQYWYQCIEIDHPSIANNPIEIYRKYHHYQIISKERMNEVPSFWYDQYQKLNIDLNKIYHEEKYWYDDEIRLLFNKYGCHHFKKLAIWDDSFKANDPRNFFDKIIHFWLKKSQPHYFTKARKIDTLINNIFHY